MIINFISSKDSDEIPTVHTKSNNIKIMMGSETDKIIEELFSPCNTEKIRHAYKSKYNKERQN